MPRACRIKYSPSLSVSENAKKNGVSEAGIRLYIKNHNIDRRYEAKLQIIYKCRAYLKKHPDATISEVHKNVEAGGKDKHYSVSTIRKYWKYILKEEPINFDSNGSKKVSQFEEASTKRKSTKNYPLMSSLLVSCKEILGVAEQEDVSALRAWLLNNPSLPLLCIGNGGMHTSFPVLLYEMNKGVGKAITPLEFASMSNAAIKTSKIILITGGGHNMDITYAAQRAARLNRANTACIAFEGGKNNNVFKALKGNNCFLFNHDTKEGFLTILGKFLTYGLLYKAFTGEEHFVEKLNLDISPEECFKYQINLEGRLPSLSSINHFSVLYGSYGEPIAREMESTMVESGLASVVVSDYRNYCHGRFMHTSSFTEAATSSKESNVCMVLLITPRERRIAAELRRRVFPESTPILIIETKFYSPLASIDLLYKSSAFISVLGEKYKDCNPNNPTNHSSIDKRVPKSEIEFEDDLKKFGALDYKEPSIEEKKQEIQEKIDSTIEAERENTDYLEKKQPIIQPPTVADLRKDEPEVYDATKVLTYAFRRKTDLRKGQPIPFGNMNGGFSFKLQGHTFLSSECAYIAGMFSNNKPEHIAIQEKLLVEKSGYSAKKEIRRKNESLAREDWYTFNVEWMLNVVWTKVKQNKKFRQLLMAVPDNAILIEDTTYQKGATSSFWGAKNAERKEFSKLVEMKLDYENLDVSLEDEEVMRDALVNQVCNIGTYVGCNVMGKILTICRKCQADGTEPSIDYELLRSKHIHLLGKEVSFPQNE